MGTTSMEIPPLQRVFLAFANYGKGSADLLYDMDSKAFAKLAKDCSLVTKQCTPTDVDLFFTKVKEKGERRIDFRQFNVALDLMADKKGKSRDYVINKVLEAGGPTSNATQAQFSRFHDDKSTYTGVYKNGGPTNYDGKKDLAELMDRTPGNVRGVSEGFGKGNAAPHRAIASFNMVHEVRDTKKDWRMIKAAIKMKGLLNKEAQQTQERREQLAMDPGTRDELRAMFLLFASYGKGTSSFTVDMDNKNWIKMCRDCGIVTANVNEVDLDLFFTKAKYKGTRKLDYNQFQTALGFIAQKEGVPVEKISEKIVKCGGPISYSTQSEYVPFHDDKSTYTGAFKYGDASLLNARPSTSQSSAPSQQGRMALPPEHRPGRPISRGIGQPAGGRPQQQASNAQLFEVFMTFANYGKGSAGQTSFMDSKNLQKLAKDCQLIGRDLTTTDIDLLFTKAKEKGKRTISYEQFVSILHMFATKKGQASEQVIAAVSRSSGPVTLGTAPPPR
eukprot:jgi/Tetstr1/437644/TSEL_026311.t1